MGSFLNEMINMILGIGMEGVPKAMEILINEVMKNERTHALKAEPYERSEERRGYANGFKPKTLHTRMG